MTWWSSLGPRQLPVGRQWAETADRLIVVGTPAHSPAVLKDKMGSLVRSEEAAPLAWCKEPGVGVGGGQCASREASEHRLWPPHLHQAAPMWLFEEPSSLCPQPSPLHLGTALGVQGLRDT